MVDFIWSREALRVLLKELNFRTNEQELICLIAINFIADYHQDNFFHGDIKPDNLFINDRFEMTSDAGTILYLM